MRRAYLGWLHDRLILFVLRRMGRAVRLAVDAGDKDEARAILKARNSVSEALSADFLTEDLERIRRSA